MRTNITLSRRICILFGVALVIAITGLSNADQVGNKQELDIAWKKSEKESKDLIAGHRVVQKAELKNAEQIADATARYWLLRITHPSTYEGGQLARVHYDFTNLMNSGAPDKSEKNKTFLNILGPKMVETMKELLQKQDPTKDGKIIVNAAIMLPGMAKLKQENIGAYLDTLLQSNETHDVVRLYAAKALKEYLPITPQPNKANLDLTDKAQEAKRKLDAVHVDALTKFIERAPKGVGMSQGEIDGFRFMRREAIVTLSRAESPAVLAANKKQLTKDVPIMGPVAPTLLKVLAKGQLQPPPSLQEKVEAAIGLAEMKFTDMQEYNPEVATYLIGQTLVEFGQEYSKDLVNLNNPKLLPKLPWKHDAISLKKALQKYAENVKAAENAGNAPNSNVKVLSTVAEPILTRIAEKKNIELNDLLNNLPTWHPKFNKAFRTLDTPAIAIDGK